MYDDAVRQMVSNASSNNQLGKLRCLHTGSELLPISAGLLQAVNLAIRHGQLRDSLGRVIDREITDGLTNASLTICYPIVDHAIQMMRDEAIPLSQIDFEGLRQ